MTELIATPLCCPACRGAVAEDVCEECGRSFPLVAGLPDFRLVSDRYLSLNEERAKAERLARIAEKTDLEGVARAYYAMTHDVDPPRCRKFLAHILGAEARGTAVLEGLEASGPVLEVGCGTGGLLVVAAQRGVEISGVDIASRWLVVARRRLDDHACDAPLYAASADALPWQDATFGAVVADSVIEHVDDPLAALREWRRVLKPGGRLRLWSPNRLSLAPDPHVRLWGIGFLPRIWADGYSRLRRGGAWVPRTLTAKGMRRLANKAGFNAVRTAPPRVPQGWIAEVGGARGALLKISNLGCCLRTTQLLLETFGPLWTLEARA